MIDSISLAEPPLLIPNFENPFWIFSSVVYQHPIVKERCLFLQDQFEFNVNLLLLCCWLAIDVKLISKEELSKAMQSIKNWQNDITTPLREIRKRLKLIQLSDPTNHFYQEILNQEIISEKYQQLQLFNFFSDKLKPRSSYSIELAICYFKWILEIDCIFPDDQLIHEFKKLVELSFSIDINSKNKTSFLLQASVS